MSYKRSKIYLAGFEQALLVEEVCRRFPVHERFSLAQQLRNSSRSVVANYVESYIQQKNFPTDFRRFLTYSQGSCDETKFWVEFAWKIHLLDEATYQKVMKGYDRLSRLIFGTLTRVPG